MVAAVLTLLWRQVPSVQELNRLLARENLLWCRATKIAQQSLAERFLVFPAELFERVFKDLLPQLQQNWQQRTQRSLTPLDNRAILLTCHGWGFSHVVAYYKLSFCTTLPLVTRSSTLPLRVRSATFRHRR